MNVYRGKLEPTKTYRKRWWLFVPTPAMPCDGFLLLGQLPAQSLDIDEQTYGVQEVRSPHGLGWRSFSVRKLGAAVGAADEQYTTSVGPGGKSVCTCDAGRARTEVCRHRCGLRAACDAGAIPTKPDLGA